MAAPDGVERRKAGRRDEDQMTQARIKALEDGQQKQGRMLGKAVKELNRHVKGCESSAEKNAQDNATIIRTQGQHGAELTDLSKKIAPVAEWHAAHLKRAEFWARLADRITDKIIERAIVAVLVAIAAAVGGPLLGKLIESLTH